MTVVRARDAASLIIYRGRSDQVEILMGRRHHGNRAFPNFYVFPGGTLEAADRALLSPHPINTGRLAKAARSKIQELAHTAIRETFEETGLLLAEKGQINRTSHPTWEEYRRRGMKPAPHHLHYLGRAITPSESPVRFHARFFVAPEERFSGSLVDNGELSDLRWVPLSERSGLPMLDVTQFMLEELQRFFTGQRQGTPLMSYRLNHKLIRYESGIP